MKQANPILLVEDDPALARLILDELESDGWLISHAKTLTEARGSLLTTQPTLIITDLRLPDGNGMSLVHEIMESKPAVPPAIIVITAFGSVRQAVEALQAGADDFLTKPLDLDHFVLTVQRVLETRELRQEVQHFRTLSADEQGMHDMKGQSPAMRQLFEQIRVIARAQGPVLINGESGTGKELIARALHAESDRADKPFLAVNCAGIPQELLESEFFGHAAGAFTGARKQRKGLLQEADGGTLLLDEIAEMPLALQAKLLRALQDGSIRPVGTDREEHVDVRIMAATHRDLKTKVAEGEFREDLYYRLETFSLLSPPLRERADDMELLAQRFLMQHSAIQKKSISGFSQEAMQHLHQYDFPGNVRELRNIVERAVAFCQSDMIQPAHLPARLLEQAMHPRVSHSDDIDRNITSAGDNDLLAGAVLPTLEQLQKRYVKRVLNETGGNKRRAAALLGIGRRTLYRWLDEPL
ncbi:sigma-54-dependent transcriptional regulator [Nitrincola sp. MINF-07-Sa-05]|uniref:sigma-54-dependent transcriptional regulator n=1 Tax=Nitrincola salilacus TaxID=3400273 RepID=UPI003917E1F5